MNGKLSNASLVVVLLVAFSLFVAGLTASTDGGQSVRGGPATPTPTRTPTPVNIGNLVWNDANGNGIQDGAGEPGVPGVTVVVASSVNGATISSAVTNASGLYTVVVPFPGNYYLRVTPPPGSVISPKNQGGNDQTDSDANPNGWTDQVVIASNVISTTIWDFGLVIPMEHYTPLPPARLLDTRSTGVTIDGVNQIGRRQAGSTLTLQVSGRAGVFPGAAAATLSITAVQPAGGTGYLTVYPCTPQRPNSSALNTAGATIANEVIASLSATGTVCIFTSIEMHLVVDVGGVFAF